MKKLFFLLLLIAGVFAASLFAQVELTIVGGLNLSTVKYNDNTVDNYVDISMKSGMILGVEAVSGPLIIGGSFIQRGANFKASQFDFEGSDTYNYLSVYLLYPVSIQKQISIFGGCQLGKGLNGTAKSEYYGDSETFDLKAEDFKIDFGLSFGADFMFSTTVGARASYYIGLADVAEGVTSTNNFKNRGIEICLLYKI